MANDVKDYFSENPSTEIRTYCDGLLRESHIDLDGIIGLAHRLTILDSELKSTNYKQRNYMVENMYGNMIGLLHDNYPEMMGAFISYVNKYYPTKTEWILDLAEYKKNITIALPFHIEEMEQRLVTAKKNLPQAGEQGV